MQLRQRSSFAFALALLTAAVSAQTPGNQTPQDSVDNEVQEMRRQLVDGRTYRSHVRVTVRLKNGNRLQGIVKDGFVVERIDGMKFVAAEASEAGAGMRLFYWNGRNNFVFLPFEDIQDYHINARLSSQQLAQIERETRAREEENRKRELEANAAAAARAAAQARAEPGTPMPLGEGQIDPQVGPQPTQPIPAGTPALPTGTQAPATPTPSTPAEGGVGAELQQLYSLLQEYPPTAGWNAQKRDEIARRKAVVGANPSPQELKFVDNFADWQRACALFGAKPVEQSETDGGEGRRGRRRR